MTSYVLIEYDKDEGRNVAVPLLDDLFSYEVQHVGDPDGWEKLDQAEPGYYKVELNTDTDQEYCDGHPIGPAYAVITGIAYVTPAPFFGRWLWFVNGFLPDFLHLVTGPFRRIWGVDFEYGGGGIRKADLWLVEALFWRFVVPARHYPWGPGTTEIRLWRN